MVLARSVVVRTMYAHYERTMYVQNVRTLLLLLELLAGSQFKKNKMIWMI